MVQITVLPFPREQERPEEKLLFVKPLPNLVILSLLCRHCAIEDALLPIF